MIRKSMSIFVALTTLLFADAVLAQKVSDHIDAEKSALISALVEPHFIEDQPNLALSVQQNLRTLGLYEGSIDGIIGPVTKRAIKEFKDIASIPHLDDNFGRIEAGILLLAAQIFSGSEINTSEAIIRATKTATETVREKYEEGRQSFLAHDYAKAEKIYRQVLFARERVLGPDHAVTLETIVRLSGMVKEQGRYAEAEKLRRHILAARERLSGPNHGRTQDAKKSLARILTVQGRYAEAEILYRQVLAVEERERGRNNIQTLLTRSQLGSTLRRQGRYVEAEVLHREVVADWKSKQGPTGGATLSALSTLAATLKAQGKYVEAERLERQILAAREQDLGNNHLIPAGARARLAHTLRLQGRSGEAEELYRKTLAVEERQLGGDHLETLVTLNNLAVAISEQGRHSEAEELYRYILDIREKKLGPDQISSMSVRQNLAISLNKQGKTAEALSVMEAVLKYVPEAFLATGRIVPNPDLYLKWSWSNYQTSAFDIPRRTFEAQGYFTYGTLDVALNDTAARKLTGNIEAASLLRDFQDARNARALLRQDFLNTFRPNNGAGEETRARIRNKLDATEAQLSAASERMEEKFPALSELKLPRPLNADEAQKLLRPREGLLVYASTEEYLYGWLVTAEGVQWRRIDLSRSELGGRVTHLRSSVDLSSDHPSIPNSKCALYSTSPALTDRPYDLCKAQDLHDKILGAFDLNGIDELIIVPDGPLETLPFSLLVTDLDLDGRPRWLIEKFAVTTLPTTSSLRALRLQNTSRRDDDRLPFLGIAPVKFDVTKDAASMRGAALPSLPGTKDEVYSISARLGAGGQSIMTEQAASEANVKSTDLSRYDVVSFATHGLLSRETKKWTGGRISEMALALIAGDDEDGLLTASEVANLRLDADWVLLSACNTAAGSDDDAQGLSGLARAFFFAGARAVLVTHWYIDDMVTPLLMGDMIENYNDSRNWGRAQSLRSAQLNIITKHDFAHPYFWAPFSVVGDNR